MYLWLCHLCLTLSAHLHHKSTNQSTCTQQVRATFQSERSLAVTFPRLETMYLAGHGRESGSYPEPGIIEGNAKANDAG